MNPDFERILSDVDLEPGATEGAIGAFPSAAGFELPLYYVDFLRFSNGGEGSIGDHFVILWPVEDLVKFNAGYEVEIYAPGLFLFGSNGGGEAFAFDKRRAELPIVMVPFIPMDVDEAVDIASTFSGFIEALQERSDFLDL